MNSIIITTVGILVLASSCIVDDPPTRSVAQQVTACPWAFCGNSPKLGNVFYELDMAMQAYSQLGSSRIKSFQKAGTVLQLIVQGFHVTGKANGVAWTDAQLTGAVFTIEQRVSGSNLLFEVTIADVEEITYYEGGDDGTTLPVFQLTYRQVGSTDRTGQHLCPNNSDTMFDRYALLFTGNRYDLTKGGVIAMGDSATYPWFTVACSDDSVWKAALMRHVWAARAPSFDTDQNDHTAAVRAIRADYCGDGVAHTELGTKVDWANRGGWLTFNYPRVEAIWDERGAACLRHPRIPGTNLGCQIPSCTDSDLANWIANGYRFITKVP